MRQKAKKAGRILVLFLLGQSVGGCGILGPKSDPGNSLNLSIMTGCLNTIAPDIQAYLVGQVSQTKWAAGWDCTISLLNLFQRYTGTGRSFSTQEIQNFANLELVTNSPVPLDFVQAAFDLKASILGGSNTLVTNDELSAFVQILQVLKTETTSLIPYFAYRANEPSPSRMLELSQAIDASTQRISQAFEGLGSMPFPGASLNTLVSEAVKTFKLPIPANTANTILAMKAILFAGSPDAIEPEAWIRLIQTTGTIGGPLIAAASVQQTGLTQPNELGEFIYQLVLQALPVVDNAIDLHSGAIDLSLIHNLVSTFTQGLAFGSLSVAPEAANSSLDVVFDKIFKSTETGVIDSQGVNAIMSFYDRWRRGQTHLETIFRNYALNQTSIDASLFENAATQYSTNLDATGQSDVARLINLAAHYRPMYYGTDTEMSFIPTLQQSMGNLSKVHLMNLASELILDSYASDQVRFTLSSADWATLIADFTPLGVDLGAIDPNVDQFAARRFREVDLFTLGSNGDTFLDIDELTYYAATIFSLSSTMSRVRADIESICDLGIGLDGMKWHWMDPVCFRREFYARSGSYWVREPFLIEQYAALDAADQLEFQVDTEKAARLNGYSASPIGGYDANGFMLVTLLQENFFGRFDANQDGWLNTDEGIASAAPMEIFMANQAGVSLSDTAVLQAIQTYVLNTGTIPSKDAAGILALGAWILERPFWNLHVVRPAAYKTAYIFADFN